MAVEMVVPPYLLLFFVFILEPDVDSILLYLKALLVESSDICRDLGMIRSDRRWR